VGSVVVGIDGSNESMAALDWAAEFAARFDHSLAIIVTWHLPTPTAHGRTGFSDADFHTWADEVISTASMRVAERHPSLRIDQRVVEGSPGEALVNSSGEASLLVVGTRRRLGTVSSYCAHYASCPVVIVR